MQGTSKVEILQSVLWFITSFHAASDADNLWAREPWGTGNTSDQTDWEPGDRNGPQVSLRKTSSAQLFVTFDQNS